MSKVGTTDIKGIMLGSTEISKVYLGTDVVYQNLPYDAEIEYLETQRNCYIVTNSIPSGSNIAISSKFMFIGYVNDTSWLPWYISYVNENTQTFRIARDGNSNTTVRINNGAVASGANGDAQFDVSANGIYEIVTNGQTITVNGVTKTSREASSSLNTASMRILNSAFIGRCYYFKMWNGNTLLLDCIPVRVGTTGYLYDKVSKQLFGNAGTGDFILGQDIKPIEYLESTGTQYINTSMLPNATDTLNIDFKLPVLNSGAIMGFRYKTRNNLVELWCSASNKFQAATGDVDLTNIADADTEMHHFSINPKSGTATLDGNSTYVGNYTVNVPRRPYLFCTGIGNVASNFSKVRIYRFYIEGKIDLVPIRIGSAGYMHDKISGRFFGNSGTGDFVLGPDVT